MNITFVFRGISISIDFTPFKYKNKRSVLGDNCSMVPINEISNFVYAKYWFVVNMLHKDLMYNPNGMYSREYKNWMFKVRIYNVRFLL